ncbi:hypothetical protein DYQ67_005047, partial [Escherichia coli]|nr:hypothetical protein [Escherichia coli]EEV7182625.1 hypothetical protein [Escherichia coli]EEX5159297.1 hypothetical protein [Escherichia coli]EEX6372072.1 hypothetical protein [Escherichia coli]EEZ4157835.1 hypothetical protein [Escherichia coli]
AININTNKNIRQVC